MSTEIVSLADMDRIAQSVAKSGLFGIKTPDQALALMALCQAEGLHPAKAIAQYHIIQGRPALKSDALLARFQEAGGRVEWPHYANDRVTGKFSHPQGGTVEITWTMADAARAGLAGKDNWKSYPRAMLRSRVIAEGVRTVYPGIATGIYTVEEVRDMGPTQPGGAEIAPALTQADEVEALKSAQTDDELKALYVGFYKLARAAGDEAHMHALTAAKDQRKAELPAVVVEPEAA